MRTLNEYFLTVKLTDLSTLKTEHVTIPDGGEIREVYVAANGGISSGTAQVAVSIDGPTTLFSGNITSTSDGTIVELDKSVTHTSETGSILHVGSDGGSTGAASANITIVIRR